MGRERVKTRHRGIYLRDFRYVVWYSDSDGKGRTVTLPEGSTERDALERQAELRTRKAKGQRVVASKVRFSEYADRWLELTSPRLKPASIRTYRWALERHLKPAFGRRLLRDVSADDVAHLVSKLQKSGMKGWSAHGVLTPLSRMYASAVREGIVHANPVRQLDKTERPKGLGKSMRILSSDEIRSVIENAPPRYRPVISTLVFTGMRIGEALSLRWSDVDFHASTITVPVSKTEAGRGRQVAVMPSLVRMLREHKLQSPFSTDDDYVFSSESGSAMLRPNVAARGLGVALERSGLEHCRLHDLRHTYASLMIGRGMDVTFVANQLGHANPQVTLSTYAKLFDPESRRDEARMMLEGAFGSMLGKQ